MKSATKALLVSLLAVAAAGAIAPAGAQEPHKLVAVKDIKFGKGPASLPPGAEAVTLYGDPAKEGMFVYRIKLPAGYHIPPHTHPRPEIVTVLSGTMLLGMGEKADKAKAEALPAGSFFAFEPGMAHFVFTEGEAVVQLSSTGPWGLTYVNPADDPRKTR